MQKSETEAEVFAEAEDDVLFWHNAFGKEFIEKLNSKFHANYTVQSLFGKLASALKSPNQGVTLDWLSTEEINEMVQQAGKTTLNNQNSDRILVMIEAKDDSNISIPFTLNKQSNPQNEWLLKVIRRLKGNSQNHAPQKEKQSNGLFLTETYSEKKDKLMEENEKLKQEVDRMKSASHNDRYREDRLKTEREVQALKGKISDLEIELSVLPTLKKQLKDKNKEIEQLNLYIREVEICMKIRAPIPSYSAFSKNMSKKGDLENQYINEDGIFENKERLGGGFTSTKRSTTTGGSEYHFGQLKKATERVNHHMKNTVNPAKEIQGIYTRTNGYHINPSAKSNNTRTKSQSKPSSLTNRSQS